MNKTGWWLVMIGVVLVLVGWWLYQGSGEDGDSKEQGWLPCGSGLHDLQFKCPPGWELEEIVNTKGNLSLKLSWEDSSQETVEIYGEERVPVYEINVVVAPNPKELEARGLHLGNFAPSSRALEETQLEAMSVGGQSGIVYKEGTAPASGPSVGVLVTKGERAYRFVYSAMATQETHNKYKGVFDQLLQTVKLESEMEV